MGMNKKTSTGIAPNISGLLCYVLGWISGLVFYLIEKDNKFVRFHALQSMIVFGSLFAAQIVLNILMSVLTALHLSILIPVFILLSTLIFLASFILWIILMVKAFQEEKFKLPVAGDLAENNT